MTEIAQRIAEDGGAALIADYGEEKLMGDTIRVGFNEVALILQGIQNHKLVPIFQDPGNVDLSCNVNFSALKKAAKTVGESTIASATNFFQKTLMFMEL